MVLRARCQTLFLFGVRLHVLVLAVLLSACSALLSACGTQPDRALDLEPATGCIDTSGSWLLERIGRDDYAVDAMTPRFYSTRLEAKPPTCPLELDIESRRGRAASAMRDLFCRLGRLDFGRLGATDAVTNEASAAIAARWLGLQREVASLAEGAGPVRLLVKHYPQPDAPGTVVTVQATLYTVPDLFFDEMMEVVQNDMDAPLRGVLVRVRKTYQLAGPAPRLVGAWIEASGRYHGGGQEIDYAALLDQPALLADGQRHAHFEDLAAEERLGLCWVDLSLGQGPAKTFARSYAIVDGKTRVGSMPAAWTEALLRMVERL